MALLKVDWQSLFSAETSLMELFIIGTVLYVGILILMHLMPRRPGAEISLMDMISILLITEAASQLYFTNRWYLPGRDLYYMGWDYLINILKQNVPAIDRLLGSSPLLVISDGKMLLHNMRKEYLSKEELISNLREHGIDNVADVKKVFVEPEGQIINLRIRKWKKIQIRRM